MAGTQIQYRRGSSAQNDAFTGALGEITVDTTNDIIRVHDGSTAGGFSSVSTTATQTLTNKTLTAPTLSGNTTGTANINITGTVTATSFSGDGSQLSGIDATTIQNGTSNVSVISSNGNVNVNVNDTLEATFHSGGLNVSALGIAGTAITATATELNYVDGVTSAIQTQLNAKAPLASPALTGTPTAPTAAVNTNTTQIATTAYVVAQIADDAPTKTGTGASGTWGISITGTAALATSVTATANNTTNETVYLTFVDGATGTQGIETDTNLTYNPSTNVLSTTASSARYADLAEKYTTDRAYEPGTVVIVGGDAEATACSSYADHKVLGIISTAPAYLMNSTSGGQDVALIGRVPCKVTGPIERGDLLVTSATEGHAEVWDPQNVIPGSIIGKALEAKTDAGPGVIEVAVGKV